MFVRSNPAHAEVYSIQHYVIKFVSDLRQVGGVLWVLRFSPPILNKTHHHNIAEILLKVVFNTITTNPHHPTAVTRTISYHGKTDEHGIKAQ